MDTDKSVQQFGVTVWCKLKCNSAGYREALEVEYLCGSEDHGMLNENHGMKIMEWGSWHAE